MKNSNFYGQGQSLIGIIIVLVVAGLIFGGFYLYLSKQLPEMPEITEKSEGEKVIPTKEITLSEEIVPTKEEIPSEEVKPEITCKNECTPRGLKRCSENGYQICKNYDSDNCLEWSPITDCPQNSTCQNGECVYTQKQINTEKCSSHLYGYPNIDFSQLKIYAFYLVPKDRVPVADWKQKIDTLLNRVKTFHESQLKGSSVITYEIYDQPIIGSFTTQGYRDKGYGGWYGAMCGEVMPVKDPIFGQFASYIIFADWGQEDDCSNYYVNRCKGEIDISDIKQCGGAGAAHWGNYNGGYAGCGLIPEEAWKHPEVPGTDTVVYHEGFGHAANIPHSNPLDPSGVMGTAYYNCLDLSNSYIEPEILNSILTCIP